MHKKLMAAVALGALLAGSTAKAADIAWDPANGPFGIVLSGMINPGDDKIFEALAAKVPEHSPANVALFGPGGNAVAALSIGATIQARGWSTSAYEYCVSSCGYIWLAGKTRWAAPTSRIGFHAIYNPTTMQESGQGNAMLGGYLALLGLKLDAVLYLTSAGPMGMTYLTAGDAAKYGIVANNLPQQVAAIPAAPVAPAPSQVPVAAPTPAPVTAGRDCTHVDDEVRRFFPSFFTDCDPRTVTALGPDHGQWGTVRVWDRYVPSSGRWIQRTLQHCPGCEYYRLIARDHDADGGSAGGSVCYFGTWDGKSWSDCVSTGGDRYALKQASVAWFYRIAAGADPGA